MEIQIQLFVSRIVLTQICMVITQLKSVNQHAQQDLSKTLLNYVFRPVQILIIKIMLSMEIQLQVFVS